MNSDERRAFYMLKRQGENMDEFEFRKWVEERFGRSRMSERFRATPKQIAEMWRKEH